MTLKSLAFSLFTRLYTRFGLEPTPVPPGGRPEISTTIFPVTQADELFRRPSSGGGNADLSGSAYVAFDSVPDGERWTLKYLKLVGTTGTIPLAVVVLRGGVPREISPDSASEAEYVGNPIILDEGGSFGAIGGGQAGDNVRGWNAIFEVSDAF